MHEVRTCPISLKDLCTCRLRSFWIDSSLSWISEMMGMFIYLEVKKYYN